LTVVLTVKDVTQRLAVQKLDVRRQDVAEVLAESEPGPE
jgi:hypothetical protein